MTISTDLLTVHDIPTRDSHMAYREAGSGPSAVFLHGNPTSSYVWRNVIPRVAGRARCLAPDLIGMGSSGQPDIKYRFADHAQYLDAWFEAVGLEDVVLIGYDWGGVLAMHWAERHAERVRGLVVFETFLGPMSWSEWPPRGAELFRALRTPDTGERMVLEENQFLAVSLATGVMHGLSDDDRAVVFLRVFVEALRTWPVPGRFELGAVGRFTRSAEVARIAPRPSSCPGRSASGE